MSTLSADQGKILVQLARETIASLLGIEQGDKIDQKMLNFPVFQEKRGIFVTLKKGAQLRGCIGSIAAIEPLVEGIRHQAENAAFNDTRFKKVKADELDDIDVEISILSEPAPLEFTDPQDLVAKLRPHIDGVILSYGRYQSTFLPQVWDQLADPEDFLGHLAMKAGLPKDGWKNDGIEIKTYQVQHFEDETS